MRLNKFLSLTLNLSRRASDDLIASGGVKLNQNIAKLGNRVEPDQDTVEVNGKIITLTEIKPTYLLLNKPTGYLSSKVSQGGVPTVYELLPKEYQNLNLNIAGRLDKETCGLILLTNDGDYLNKITHPGFNKQKTYIVHLNKEVSPEDLTKLKSGVQIGESRPSSFEEIKVLSPNELDVVLTEGRNRQIRRTFWELGYKVTFLKRTQMGDHKLEDLQEGETREIPEPGSLAG